MDQIAYFAKVMNMVDDSLNAQPKSDYDKFEQIVNELAFCGSEIRKKADQLFDLYIKLSDENEKLKNS